MVADFTGKPQKVENLSLLAKKPLQTFSSSTVEHLDEVARVHTRLRTPNDDVLQPPALSATASSPESSQPPTVTGHGKNALLRAVFKYQLPIGSPASTTIITDLETHSATANSTKKHGKVENPPIFTQEPPFSQVSTCFPCENDVSSHSIISPALTTLSATVVSAENHQNTEKMPIFTPKTPEPWVSTHFSWADDANKLPILPTAPTKQPRDLSDLRSSSKNSFSSLQRRYHKFNKKRFHFINSTPQYHCHHMFPGPYHHFQNFRQHSQPPFSASLNWDQDPRLSDLNNALKALSWVRR
jgi:hypothetical protein